MIWLWTVVGALLVGLAVRFIASVKIHVLKLQAKYQAKFFDYANEVANWEGVSDERLGILSELADDLRSRKTQIIVLEAIRRGLKREKEGIALPRDARQMNSDLSEDKRLEWNRLYFRWLIAVCAQGSIAGVGSLVKALEYFDPDDREKLISVSRLQTANARAH